MNTAKRSSRRGTPFFAARKDGTFAEPKDYARMNKRR